MAKPKRINVHREAKELAESYINGNISFVLTRAPRPGPTRVVMPVLISHYLMKGHGAEIASRFIKSIIDMTVRD